MNPTTEEQAQQLTQLAAHVGAAFLFGLAILLFVLIAVALTAGFIRTVCVLVALVGILTFWIPSPITMILSPITALLGISGIFINTARVNYSRKRDAELRDLRARVRQFESQSVASR